MMIFILQPLRSESEKEAPSEEQKQSLEKELEEALASRDAAASELHCSPVLFIIIFN